MSVFYSFLPEDAINRDYFSTFATETNLFENEPSVFRYSIKIPQLNNKRDKRRLPLTLNMRREHWRYSTISRWGVESPMD